MSAVRLALILSALFIALTAQIIAGPLHEAAAKGDLDAAKKALARGAKVNEFDKNDYTPLIKAVLANRPEMVKYLIKRGANVNLAQKRNKYTPLHWSGQKPEIAAILLKAKAKVNVKNHIGRTPLHSAHNLDVVKMLIKAGLKPDEVDGAGGTPLSIQANGMQPEIVEYLIALGANVNGAEKRSPLCAAAAGGRIENIKLLLAYGADVNRKDGRDQSYPLHSGWNADVARILLENGAKPNVKDRNGQTPKQKIQKSYLEAVKKKDKRRTEQYKAVLALYKKPPKRNPIPRRKVGKPSVKDASTGGSYRVWTDSKGRTVTAKFGGVKDGKAALIKADGKKLRVKLSSLSEADREWIRKKGK